MTRRILIVDSDIAFTVQLKRALEETGNYVVRTVTRLAPAKNAMEEEQYDIALIDAGLDQANVGEVIRVLREIKPEMPVIITSLYQEDEDQVRPLLAQAFMKKRFVARALIPVLEKVIADGFSPFTAETRANAPILPEHDEDIEALIEQSRQHKIVFQMEPLPEAGDSTISEVIERARDPETSQRIQESLFGEPLVQNPSKLLYQQQQQYSHNPHPPQEQEGQEPTPAENALNTDPDEVLDVIRQQAQGTPVEAPETISQIMEALTPPDELPSVQPLDPVPFNEDTFSFRSPMPPPMLPDQQFIDQLPQQTEAAPAEELVPATVQAITQQLIATTEEEIKRETEELAAVISDIPEWVLSHYALQLTQFSLESSAQGTLLTRGSLVLAKAGEIDESVWQTIQQLVVEAWSRPGDARTRVIYRRLPLGEMLLYSIQTVDDQVLTLVFSADTSLGLIRKQAGRLAEALHHAPETPDELPPAPVKAPPPPPIAEPTRVAPPAPMPMPVPPAAVEEPEIPVTPESSHTEYACFWLLDISRNPLSAALIQQLSGWLTEFCDQQKWQLSESNLQPDWVLLRLNVPSEMLPSNLVETLMQESAQFIQQASPNRPKPIWSDGYLVTTPAADLNQEEINRFIQFYRHEKIQENA